MNERLKFVAAHARGEFTMSELCARFGVSRKTGYKLLSRYRSDGVDGLKDRSRAPRGHPNQTPVELEVAILRVRRAHPTWGSKKILAVLERDNPRARLPARSTIDEVLRRAGLVTPRRRRRSGLPPREKPKYSADRPNDVWSADFKGWFTLGNGVRCAPLTINDVLSRFSLRSVAMCGPKLDDVKLEFEACFREFGLPLGILVDNGPPFGSSGIGGLTRLSVWWVRVGIAPHFIQPGKPQQNGRHERFHRTLGRETAKPPSSTLSAQQCAFTRFRRIYNEERPHEALGMLTPSEIYERSPREYHGTPDHHEYPDEWESRSVHNNGSIKLRQSRLFVGEAMIGERVGLEPIDDGIWRVHLGALPIGVFDERARVVVPEAKSS